MLCLGFCIADFGLCWPTNQLHKTQTLSNLRLLTISAYVTIPFLQPLNTSPRPIATSTSVFLSRLVEVKVPLEVALGDIVVRWPAVEPMLLLLLQLLLLLLLMLLQLEAGCRLSLARPGGNCIKRGLPGKSILGDYFQENRTSRRPFLLLRISFPGRPIFIQLPVRMTCVNKGLPTK